MPALNWDAFTKLPGSAENNFELLCRGIVRRNFGSYGVFRALANQPGVEFHLKLDQHCDALGNPSRWWGWQCKWYDLPPSGSLGATRRSDIEDGIRKAEAQVAGLTSVQSAGTGEGHAAPCARKPGSDAGATSDRSLVAENAALAEDDEPATPGETSGGGPGAATLSDAGAWEAMRAIAAREDELLRKWWDARIVESAAGTELERVIAKERTLQAELAIVWERGKATRLGEAWYATKQEREWEWRWRALREVSRERRRLIRRRRLRRLLSLGLWRS